jgi:hypothetical protein
MLHTTSRCFFNNGLACHASHSLTCINTAEKTREVMVRLMINAARDERAATAARVGADSVRVGRVSYDRQSMFPIWHLASDMLVKC